MSSEAIRDAGDESWRKDFRTYFTGGLLALLLTGAAFWLVAFGSLPLFQSLIAITLLAIIQIVVHFRFFLHISWRSHRDDLQLILFTSLIIFLIVGGSVWILANLHGRMT
jgi:cytochrome o ubiquinol oxidase subunit IV